ncbi:MAG: undecaprenyl/decaprenyl-phosphate alpha-N-acetylglucosaminyl 1-phosphate transferase [Bacteroidetes bacterium]|nr:undecaprenyl/decaprenyl-phosphate alpha-N-acetylglucosaminyl 1-phosphate transferase [Bacteroidota bacterium]
MNLSYPAILTTFFFACFVFAVLINYILLKFVQTLGIRGKEALQVRWNPNSKPALGGISFYVVFLFALIFTVLLANKTISFNLQLIGIFIASTLAFMMGLADDAFNTQPLLKFLTQIFCAFILIYTGHSITIFQNEFINYIVTVIWVVGMMNSVNMLDNMDGITCIVSIAAFTFLVAINISLHRTNNYATILNLGVLGALCGFLVYNFHPSKMFMGDTGSQFLGLFLAAEGIDNCWNNSQSPLVNGFPLINILLVALVFVLPLTDTTTVVINRLRAGRSPFIGGKDHTTHHLFFKGVTEKRIAILYFIISSIACVLAYSLVFHFSYPLFYASMLYFAMVFVTLYINTVIKKG